MAATLKELPRGDSSPEEISILLVGTLPAEISALQPINQHERWAIWSCESCEEAARRLERYRPAVVLCDREVHDGTWRTVLALLHRLNPTPPLLVSCRHADEGLWAEVLTAGGYDVLQKPFDPAEFVRVLRLARQGPSSARWNPATAGMAPARRA